MASRSSRFLSPTSPSTGRSESPSHRDISFFALPAKLPNRRLILLCAYSLRFTGECDTKDPTGEQHVCCSAQNPEVCPKDYHLRQLTGFEIWAEGVEGQFEIDIKSISAGPN